MNLHSGPGSKDVSCGHLHPLAVSPEAPAGAGVLSRSLHPQSLRPGGGGGVGVPPREGGQPPPSLCSDPCRLTPATTRNGGHSKDLWEGAGPVAPQGWAGAGMFALTVCLRGVPAASPGHPSPSLPGGPGPAESTALVSWGEEGPSGSDGNSRASSGTKDPPASGLASSRPLQSLDLETPAQRVAGPAPLPQPSRPGSPAWLGDYANPRRLLN